MYSALPHREKAPRSWQGPSPNLKMLIRQDFPREGDFVFRVKAARGSFLNTQVETLMTIRQPVHPDRMSNTIELPAEDFEKRVNLQWKDDQWLIPLDVASDSSAEHTVKITKEGYYQLDLVHPYADATAMPSYMIQINKNQKQERLHLNKKLATKKEITQPLGLVFLTPGKVQLKVGGLFLWASTNLYSLRCQKIIKCTGNCNGNNWLTTESIHRLNQPCVYLPEAGQTMVWITLFLMQRKRSMASRGSSKPTNFADDLKICPSLILIQQRTMH